MSVNIKELCEVGLITQIGLLGSKKAEELTGSDLFNGLITKTGLLANVPAAPVMREVDPTDAEAVAQARTEYEEAVQARNAAIETGLVNYVEQIKKWTGQAESQLCDWLEMDPSSPAYIKNRTHYKYVDPTASTITTTATIGNELCGFWNGETGGADFVRLIYADGISEQVTIWPDPSNPITVPVYTESLIEVEYHFDKRLDSYQDGDPEPQLVSYQYHVTPIFVGDHTYFGPADVETLVGGYEGWGPAVCIQRSDLGVTTAAEMDAYVANHFGFDSMRNMWQSKGTGWFDLAEAGELTDEMAGEYVSVVSQFLYPEILGGHLIARGSFSSEENAIGFASAYRDYLHYVENNNVPAQTSFEEQPIFIEFDLQFNDMENSSYWNLFDLDYEYLGNPFCPLVTYETTGAQLIGGNTLGIDIPLYPCTASSGNMGWSAYKEIPEDFFDLVTDLTLGDLDCENFVSITTTRTKDDSILKELDHQYIPALLRNLHHEWKEWTNNGQTSADNLGGGSGHMA